ncbi:MAG TPA: MazG-like family protein [Cytophagaceae bacterium]
MKQLIDNVIKWAEDRNLISIDNVDKQYCKCVSELGEFADAIIKGDVDAQKDGAGDFIVTLIIMAKQLDFDNTEIKDLFKYLNKNIDYEASKIIPWITDSLPKLLMTRTKQWQLLYLIKILEYTYWAINNLGHTPKECLEVAWNEIKDRKGKTINGNFIKE